MAFQATVIPVMIASPGDVTDYRKEARGVLHEWNYIHAATEGVVLMPVGWETHSSPELGATAQGLINERVLKNCDLLIGIFWTRLGTPTGNEVSGSVEEIKRHVIAGKPAMIYFSNQPLEPNKVDHAQYAALTEFKAWCQNQGLIEFVGSPADLKEKLRQQVSIAIRENPYLSSLLRQVRNQDDPRQGAATLSEAEALAKVLKKLSPEAKELLRFAAADPNGQIYAVTTVMGRLVQVGGKQFGEAGDARAMAKWDRAIELLEDHGLLSSQQGGDSSGGVLRLKDRGFQLGDMLKASK
jgi:hypothetical protein